jgi:hypothetical protein
MTRNTLKLLHCPTKVSTQLQKVLRIFLPVLIYEPPIITSHYPRCGTLCVRVVSAFSDLLADWSTGGKTRKTRPRRPAKGGGLGPGVRPG